MCGIHGIISQAEYDETTFEHKMKYRAGIRDFIEEGFTAGALRGMDSSGMFQIDKWGADFMHKLPIMGPLFTEDRYTKTFLADVSSSPITACHVRAATEGRVSINNAHPFRIVREDRSVVIGMHNGTLTNWRSKKEANQFNVDSEWAIHWIAKYGEEAFEDFTGAWSFVWWDSKEPTKLNFARNDQRPMLFLRTKDKKSVMFGSEAGMLAWLAARNNIDVEDVVYHTKPGSIYSIDFSMGGEELFWENQGEYAKAAVQTHTRSGSSWNGYYGMPGWNYDDENYYGMDEVEANRQKALMINSINAVLRTARNERLGIEPTADEAAAAAAAAFVAGDELDEEYDPPFGDSDEDTPIDGGPSLLTVDPSWYDSRYAGIKEQAHAKMKGWFGELASTTVIGYDKTHKEILCEIYDPQAPGNGFAGYVRGIDPIKFDTEFDGNKMKMVIVGSWSDHTGSPNFVLSPLTLAGEEAMLRLTN